MRRHGIGAATVAALSCLLLAGCSATVAGTPVADTSLPTHLDTGSFSTSKRVISAPSSTEAQVLESRRMLATVPVVGDIDPTMRYGDGVSMLVVDGLSDAFGSGVAAALHAMQFGAEADFTDKAPDATGFGKGFGIAIVRMPTAAAAAQAVAAPSVAAADGPSDGEASPAKIPVAIPGVAGAKAFSKTYAAGVGTTIVALLAHARFVIVVAAQSSADKVAAALTQEDRALDSFTATPDDKLTSLPPDSDGIRARTLANQNPIDKDPTRYGWTTARGILADQTEPAVARKDFADTGVDLVGLGENTVYRAKDGVAARELADRFIAEMKGYYPGGTTDSVDEVPGSECYNSKDQLGDFGYCVVPVGRYLAEYSAVQTEMAKEATAAAYLTLRRAQ
ncbi:DUF7373 family lipoprotein [Tsukamurella soli]|uniref:Uncharacterized protein n=1 Tax=Tsukamurella soli TaxID=644556 RepID=A0ABP8JAJ8_9ACTN